MKQEIPLKARGVRYLALREHSEAELRKKLAPYAETEADVEEAISWLKEMGYLSDTRFADAYVRSRSSRFGSRKLIHELKARGVAPEIVEQAASELKETELDRARSVWAAKFGTAPADFKEQSKQIRFLQQRGFPDGVIRQVIKGAEDWTE